MIEYRKEDRIAIITINRPEALGAMTVKGFEEHTMPLLISETMMIYWLVS